MKREVDALKRLVGLLQRQAVKGPAVVRTWSATQQLRFVAKGLKSLRKRLAISAENCGRLEGIGAQSAYNWERGNAMPRAQQVTALAALRGTTKRIAEAPLAQLGRKADRKPRGE